MPWDVIFFFVLSAICLFTALLVVVSENPVHSGLFLVLCFVNVAGLFVLLGAEFLAVLQIIVYSGAVLVLLLFVLMLVDPDKLPSFYAARPLQRYVSVLIGLVLLLEVGAAIITRPAVEMIGPDSTAAIQAVGGNVQAIGRVIFSDYALALEMTSLILTVGVVGAVVLGLPERLGEKARESRSTISLGHSRGSDDVLGPGPRFETPIATPASRYIAPEGPRRVIMAKSPDDYTRVGEISR
ncbi:MAG TPA: NADH-quinone oxidoreductase subunit J [Thermomicrobiales bacterium]|nr:NADH-quinone oxidoreductase subunit J [Thermomicrobiales bacterium]